jgi:hypothetical protein
MRKWKDEKENENENEKLASLMFLSPKERVQVVEESGIIERIQKMAPISDRAITYLVLYGCTEEDILEAYQEALEWGKEHQIAVDRGHLSSGANLTLEIKMKRIAFFKKGINIKANEYI